MAHDFISRYIELEKNNENQYFNILRALVKTNAQLLVSYKKRYCIFEIFSSNFEIVY